MWRRARQVPKWLDARLHCGFAASALLPEYGMPKPNIKPNMQGTWGVDSDSYAPSSTATFFACWNAFLVAHAFSTAYNMIADLARSR
jgi:hypothetical protein